MKSSSNERGIPVSAFVAAGFEHGIANICFIPLATLLQAFDGGGASANPLAWSVFSGNLVPVILGNIIGGSVLVSWGVSWVVSWVYHAIYRPTLGRNWVASA